MAFPAEPVLLFDGFEEQPPAAVRRTETEDHFVKQMKTVSKVLLKRPVQYLLKSKADKDAFLVFFNTTINRGADWFDWTDPYDAAVKTARIVGGRISLKPRRKGLDRWILGFEIETWY